MTIMIPRPIRRTLTVPEAATLLGISSWKAYESIRTTGKLAGIDVLRVGRRVMVPADPLERLLHGKPVASDK